MAVGQELGLELPGDLAPGARAYVGKVPEAHQCEVVDPTRVQDDAHARLVGEVLLEVAPGDLQAHAIGRGGTPAEHVDNGHRGGLGG